MLILDTDILTLIQHGSGVDYDRLSVRLAATSEPTYATIVSLEEQLRGRLSVCHRATRMRDYIAATAYLHRTFDFYRRRQLLDFDDRAASQLEALKSAKVRIGTMDLRIAAIVLAHQATLITRNLSDFRKVPGLLAQDWSAASS